MLKKRVWKQLAVVGAVAMMASSSMSVRSFAYTSARSHGLVAPCDANLVWDLDGTITTPSWSGSKDLSGDSRYQFSKNADGSYNLTLPDGGMAELGYTTNEHRACYGALLENKSKEARDFYASDNDDYTKILVSVGSGDGGSSGDLVLQATCGDDTCPNFCKDFGNQIILHIKVTEPNYLLRKELYNVSPFIRDGGEQTFLSSLNEDRARYDLSALTYSNELEELAKRRVMEIQKNYVHTKEEGYGDYTECFTASNGGTRMSVDESMKDVEAQLEMHSGTKGDVYSETAKEVGVAQYVLGTNLALNVVIIR